MKLEQNFTINGSVVHKKTSETFLGHEIYYTTDENVDVSVLTYYLVKNGEVKATIESKAEADMAQGAGLIEDHEVIFKDK